MFILLVTTYSSIDQPSQPPAGHQRVVQYRDTQTWNDPYEYIPFSVRPSQHHLNKLNGATSVASPRKEPCLIASRGRDEEGVTPLPPFRVIFPLPKKGAEMRKETARDQARRCFSHVGQIDQIDRDL